MTAKKLSVSKKTSKGNQRIGKKYTKQTKTMVEPPKRVRDESPLSGLARHVALTVGRPSASLSAG